VGNEHLIDQDLRDWLRPLPTEFMGDPGPPVVKTIWNVLVYGLVCILGLTSFVNQVSLTICLSYFKFLFLVLNSFFLTQSYYQGRTSTLYVRLSQLRLTNLFFVLFLEQPRLHNVERQHNFLVIRNFLCLISRFSLFNPKMNQPDFVAEHTFSSTINVGKNEKIWSWNWLELGKGVYKKSK